MAAPDVPTGRLLALGSRRPVSPAILQVLEERELALRRCLYTEMQAMPLTVATCPLATKLGLKPMVSNKSHMK